MFGGNVCAHLFGAAAIYFRFLSFWPSVKLIHMGCSLTIKIRPKCDNCSRSEGCSFDDQIMLRIESTNTGLVAEICRVAVDLDVDVDRTGTHILESQFQMTAYSDYTKCSLL